MRPMRIGWKAQPVPTYTSIELPPALLDGESFAAIAEAANAEMWDVLGLDLTVSPALTDDDLTNAEVIA